MNTVLNPKSEEIKILTLLTATLALTLIADFLFFGYDYGAISLSIFFGVLFLLSLPLNASFYKSGIRTFIAAASGLSILALAVELNAVSVSLAMFFIPCLRLSALFEESGTPLIKLKHVLVFYLTLPFDIFQRKAFDPNADPADKSEKRGTKIYIKLSHHLIAFLVVLPIALIFLVLFSEASVEIKPILNKLGEWFVRLINFGHIRFLVIAFILSLSFLRLRIFRSVKFADTSNTSAEPIIASPSESKWLKIFLLWALATFNLIFLLENFLDLRWLLGGMYLPDGVTYSQHANNGAYALATATTIAAAFITISFSQKTSGKNWKLLRILAYIWIAQNIFLIFSASMRMLNYVWIYGFTDTRIMGFSFFALVATGFALTFFKIIKNKNTPWLINANLYAIAVMFFVWAFVDFQRITANYNVNLFIDGRMEKIDLDYLDGLGTSALPALQRLAPVLKESLKDQPRHYYQRRTESLDSMIQRKSTQLEHQLNNWRTAGINQRIIHSQME